MSFDWIALFTRYRVPYETSGRNVRAGEVNVRCPKCGAADPSFHMAISSKGWVCRRIREHKGRSRAELIRLLLNCSVEDARRLAGYEDEEPGATEDEFRASTNRLLGEMGAAPRTRPPVLPKEFHPLLDGRRFAEPFVSYMRERGYRRTELEWAAREYDLRYAVVGPFARRIIFPIRDRRGTLISWTGRTISDSDQVRYLTLSERPDRAAHGQVASAPSSDFLLGLPALVGARRPRALVICEGPFDAVRLTLYGHSFGVYATCLFGLNVSARQAEELEALSDRFPRMWLCIDEGEEMRRGTLLGSLEAAGARALELPRGAKDPGELTPTQAVALCAHAADSVGVGF